MRMPIRPYGYGTVPGGRRTIDTEGGHVVVSVSLMRNGYEYGTVPDRRVTIHTESGDQVSFKAHFWNDTRIVQFWYTRTAQF